MIEQLKKIHEALGKIIAEYDEPVIEIVIDGKPITVDELKLVIKTKET